MRAWEPEPGETPKAFAAFKTYRDLEPGERSLRVAAAAFYNQPVGQPKGHQLDQLKKWSRKFDWQERVQAYDSWLTMTQQEAVEEYVRTRTHDFAERKLALQQLLLENAEAAGQQAKRMLAWPISERRILHEETEDGTEITHVFIPARWTKQTAKTLQDMAAGVLGPEWATKEIAESEPQEPEWIADTSALSLDELQYYDEIGAKITYRKKLPGEDDETP